MPSRANLDQLQQIEELNLAFLFYLRTAADDDLARLAFPSGARGLLLSATGADLQAVAEFPRALFRLALDADPLAVAADRGSVLDWAHHDLALSILFAARHASRQSAYQARLLFGLEPADIQRLRVLPLSDLQAYARSPDILECAFADRPWLWSKLLGETRPEERRRLALIALQPGLEKEWPQRRAPQAVG